MSGLVVMGLLRAGNILLGASCSMHVVSAGLVMVAVGEGLYIYILSMIARDERTSPARVLLVTILLQGLIPLQVLFLLIGGFYMQALVVSCLIPLNILLTKQGYYAT